VTNKPLLIAVLAAVVVHLVFFFSIKSSTSEPPIPVHKSIDITLVSAPSVKAPEKAQLLAEENQLGSGQPDKKSVPFKPAVAPQQAQPAPKPAPEKIEPVPQEKPQPQPQPIPEKSKPAPQENPIPKTPPPEKSKPVPEKKPIPKTPPPEKTKPVPEKKLIKEDVSVLSKLETQQKILVQRKAEQKIVIPERQEWSIEDRVAEAERKIDTPSKSTTSRPTERHRISAASLQQQITEMGAQIRQQPSSVVQTKSKTVNQVSANKYVAAQYLKDWETKVAGVGNRNYPVVATKPNFSATLTMEVEINVNGEIESMRITQSSGNPELDEAAKKIVRMSAPFPPLPLALHKELDMLKIIRVWKFSDESGLVTR
jgi:protein TonB